MCVCVGGSRDNLLIKLMGSKVKRVWRKQRNITPTHLHQGGGFDRQGYSKRRGPLGWLWHICSLLVPHAPCTALYTEMMCVCVSGEGFSMLGESEVGGCEQTEGTVDTVNSVERHIP